MKRLGIFVMYDKDGIVDDYVTYLLKDITKILDYLVVVCNGYINEEGQSALNTYADILYNRENIGYDAAAYKAVLEEYIGWDKLVEFDELVLFNATFYGPFYSFETIFDEMNHKCIDFWGLTKHGNALTFKEHIQSFFLVIRKKLFTHNDFVNFWKTRKDNLIDVDDVIKDFEISFTQHFSEKGFLWDVFVDSSDFDDEINTSGNFNHYGHLAHTLITRHRLPILKKKVFPYIDLGKTSGEELPRALEYIGKHTTYDINMIWKNIIRDVDMNLMKSTLNLNYILSPSITLNKMNDSELKEAVIVLLLTNRKYLDYFIEYLVQIACLCNIVIFTYDKDLKADLENKLYILGLDNVSIVLSEENKHILLDECKELANNYKYLCYIHDYQMITNSEPVSISLNYNIFENMIKSKEYIANIIETFKLNPYLGLLCAPAPYHANCLEAKSDNWYFYYELLNKAVKVMNLNCILTKDSETISTDTVFWCKTDALRIIFEKGSVLKESFPENTVLNNIIARILVYTAQHQGYYSGIVENTCYASMHLDKLSYKINGKIYNERKPIRKNLEKMFGFCREYSEIYLYGAGKIAHRTLETLHSVGVPIKGFIVSDEKMKEYDVNKSDLNMYRLSDIEACKKTGIIIALNLENTKEVKKNSKNLNKYNLFYLNEVKEHVKQETQGYMKWLENTKLNYAGCNGKEIKEQYSPLISIIIPIWKMSVLNLIKLMDSISSQTYSNWEICLTKDKSSNDEFFDLSVLPLLSDKKIRFINTSSDNNLSSILNQGVKGAKGEYLLFLSAEGELDASAIQECAQVINQKPNCHMIYSDEDQLDAAGFLSNPHFKSDFNIDLLTSTNYIGNFIMVKRELADKVGSFNSQFIGAEYYDFVFRCVEQTVQIDHITRVLFHYRPTIQSIKEQQIIEMAEAGAIKAHYDRIGIEVNRVEPVGNYRVYHTEFKIDHDNPLVSIIIPNKDHYQDLDNCLCSIFRKLTYKNFEVIIVENNSTSSEIFDYYEMIQKENKNVRVVAWDKEFNYSAINNFGVSFAKGEYLLLVNNDTEIIEPNTIQEMLGFCQREDVGIVGAKLLYEDNTIQHAGVILGHGGVAGHTFIGQGRKGSKQNYRITCAQDYSAVTAAFMMTKKSVYEAVNGFSEELAVAFNDIDYCMKVRSLGKNVVYAPFAELYHYESKSRGYEDTQEKRSRFNREVVTFVKKWMSSLEQGDPYYNPNLSLINPAFTLRELGREKIGEPFNVEHYFIAVKADEINSNHKDSRK